MLDLFQLRRCEENLAPAPDHPGCIYGEMNKCLRPCQQVVSVEEYPERSRARRTIPAHRGSVAAGIGRDGSRSGQRGDAVRGSRAPASAAESHRRSAGQCRGSGSRLDRLAGVAVVPSAEPEAVDLLFLAGGRWLEPRLSLSGNASMDRRLRELCAGISPAVTPDLEHLAILVRWHGSSWRDGEWIGFDSFEKIPYRKIVNAVARVAASIKCGRSMEGLAMWAARNGTLKPSCSLRCSPGFGASRFGRRICASRSPAPVWPTRRRC